MSVLLLASAAAPGLTADDAARKIYLKALYDAQTRAQLMAAGTLNASSDVVPSTQIKDAVALFFAAYFPGEKPDVDTALRKLDEVAKSFGDFVGMADSNYSNAINIKIPAKLLANLRMLSGNTETLHASGDSVGALKYGTYRYPLRAQTPQSLLREIFYKNSNLDIETMQSDETQFLVSGFVRDTVGSIDHYFLRKAFQLGPSTTALYMKYDHVAPSTFALPNFYDPILALLVPPSELVDIEEADERHQKLLAWADSDYTKALARLHPPESVTAIRRFLTKAREKTETWRSERLDDYKREIFEIAVLPTADERREGWRTWRRNIAWRLVMRAATNISSSEFDTRNGWRTIEIDDCYTSKRNNRENPDYQEVRIVFATNRAKSPDHRMRKAKDKPANVRKLFGNKGDTDNKVHYGCAMVTVPKDPTAEKLRETHAYQDWAWREQVREETAESLKNYYSVRRYIYLGDSGDNARGERVRLLDTERWFAPREDMALLYVHGYNTAFHESLLRIAQIAAASSYPGRIYLFSWPSARNVASYVADMDASEKSDPYLAAFVQSILLDSKVKQLDVLAHSMGGQVFLRAFSRFRSSFDQVKQVRFGKVIFAAPDVSQSVFKEKINDIIPYAFKDRGVSVYASSLDRVLLLSSILRGGKPRAGDLSRDVKFESDTINVINATRPAWWCDPSQYSFLGHSYFSQRDEILQDIIAKLMPGWKRRETKIRRYEAGKSSCWYQSKAGATQ